MHIESNIFFFVSDSIFPLLFTTFIQSSLKYCIAKPPSSRAYNSIYENLLLGHEIRYLASVEIEHELRTRDGAVAFAYRQLDLSRHVVLDGMSYIGDKLRDLGKYGAIAEHLYFSISKRHIAEHIVANLLV